MMKVLLPSDFRSVDQASPLLTRIRAELAMCSYPAIRNLNCYLDQDQIFLCGSIPNYYLKQFAQNLLLRLCGGLRLQNHLQVTSDACRGNSITQERYPDDGNCCGLGQDN